MLREACDRGYRAELEVNWDVQGTDNNFPPRIIHAHQPDPSQAAQADFGPSPFWTKTDRLTD